MSSRKADLGDIDEDFLLESIKGGGKSEPLPPRELPPAEVVTIADEKPKEPGKRKRTMQSDYKATFLVPNEITIRKSVYISRDIHEMISDIVNLVGKNKIGVGGYVDTVLRHHLENNCDEINELYRKRLEVNEIVYNIKKTE